MRLSVSLVTVLFSILKLELFACHTHWIVTEDGRIDIQGESPYYMKKPHDLVALLKQEERVNVLSELKRDLNRKKQFVEKSEEGDAGFEARFFRDDADCQAAGKPLVDHDLYISTVLPLENKGIRPEEHIDLRDPPSSQVGTPVCQDITALRYSIHAYEHLHAMQMRVNMSGAAELGLKNAITHQENVDDFGHLVKEALKQNTTSWVLYNMAAFYWRIKGNPFNAVECLRRALHYSPREDKDVALISLGNLFHRSRFSEDAATVVEGAVEISEDLNVNHFTLGNIYAVLTKYNRSIECFDNTLRIQPDFEAAGSRRSAVLCHAKLERALEAKQRELQRTLRELKGYQTRQVRLRVETESLIAEQASLKARDIAHEALQEALHSREEHGHYGETCSRSTEVSSSGEEETKLVCTQSDARYKGKTIPPRMPSPLDQPAVPVSSAASALSDSPLRSSATSASGTAHAQDDEDDDDDEEEGDSNEGLETYGNLKSVVKDAVNEMCSHQPQTVTSQRIVGREEVAAIAGDESIMDWNDDRWVIFSSISCDGEPEEGEGGSTIVRMCGQS